MVCRSSPYEHGSRPGAESRPRRRATPRLAHPYRDTELTGLAAQRTVWRGAVALPFGLTTFPAWRITAHQQEATIASITDPRDTGGELIAATKVNGTAVYDTAGEKLGSVYDVLLDKVSGHADYAIMSFGGFLGIGDRYHPLPWNQLRYDTRLSGYVVGLDRGQLEAAPNYDVADLGVWGGTQSRAIDRYYGTGAGTGDAGLGPAPIR